MIKNRFIRVVLACAVVGASPAFAGLPTIDAGNIAGTIGIVTQGATGIQQGIETIANGSNLNSIIGDAAGTLAKFNEKYGDDIKKGIQAAQDAQKRISEGVEAYNKYQGEIAARKAEYDALMETVSSYTGSSSYEDGEEDGYEGEEYDTEYSADYDEGLDADYDAQTVSTLEMIDNGEQFVSDTGLAPAALRERVAVSDEMAISDQGDVSALPEAVAVRPAVINGGLQAEKLELQKMTVDIAASDDAVVAEKISDISETPEKAVAVEKIEAVSSITNETTGRRRFGSVRDSGVLKAKVSDKAELGNVKARAISPIGKAVAAEKVSAGNLKLESKIQPVARSVASTPASDTAKPAARKFRMSPSLTAPAQKLEAAPAMKIEKMSGSTISFSSRMAFAAENEDNTKGVGYDSKGTFISPLAQRCGVSIKDLQDKEKLKACTNKIVSENFAKNQYDAINSRKDCERMIYTTVIALLAETTQSKYEASNYDETLDKQEEAGSGAVDTRNDSALIALSNEQTQILLNRMSLLVSTQIILDSVKQLCAAPKDVLKEIETGDDKAGDNKTEATDGGK